VDHKTSRLDAWRSSSCDEDRLATLWPRTRLAADRAEGCRVVRCNDPIFSEKRIAYNSEEVIYATPLHEVYDAVIQYGVAHRWPAD
jgi:hypothetical protein